MSNYLLRNQHLYVIIYKRYIMLYEMNLDPKPFEMIKCGLKTIELRLYDDRRKPIKVNDIIEFTNTSDNSQKLLCKVINLYPFKNFEELYRQLPLLKCGYTPLTIASAKPSDMNKYYSDEQIMEFGVVGIELEKM